MNSGRSLFLWGWCEILKPVEAQTVAIYMTQSQLRGYDCPAVTRHSFGKGCVYYVGSLYESYMYLVEKIAKEEGVKKYELPEELECISKDDGKYLIILNHGDTREKIEIKGYRRLCGADLPAFVGQYDAEILVRQIT